MTRDRTQHSHHRGALGAQRWCCSPSPRGRLPRVASTLGHPRTPRSGSRPTATTRRRGTEDEPWATLQHAADTAPAGVDGLRARAAPTRSGSTYTSPGRPGRPITFSAAPGRDGRARRLVARGPGRTDRPMISDRLGSATSTIRGVRDHGLREAPRPGTYPIGILVTGAADRRPARGQRRPRHGDDLRGAQRRRRPRDRRVRHDGRPPDRGRRDRRQRAREPHAGLVRGARRQRQRRRLRDLEQRHPQHTTSASMRSGSKALP